MTVERTADHTYVVNGAHYPSVTTIIGRVLHPDSEATKGWRNAAMRHGSLVHAMTAMYVEGEEFLPIGDDVDETAELQMAAFAGWYDTHVETLHGVELYVAHERYQYGGQLDLWVTMKGDKMPTFIDIKSGTGVDIGARAQTIAYVLAAREMGLFKGRCRRGVLWIPGGERAGHCAFQEHKNTGDEQAFLSMLFLYRWLKT